MSLLRVNTITDLAGNPFPGSALTVNQTSYVGVSPITVALPNTIDIAASSNAYGTRTVSTLSPSGGNNGDIWYKY
jgi:hypothetical protein